VVTVKPFVLYTLARALLFAVAWALVWAVARIWLGWSTVTALWTALLAMAVSSVVSLWLLRGLRQRLALHVQGRAERMQARYEAAKRKEDAD
jgi:membrane protein implicated in regulation of membrane protease activity